MTKKERILVAAQELFGLHGYSATTVKMVAEKADVAFGLVAHYYGSKESLFIAAGDDMVLRMLDAVRHVASNAATGVQAVHAFIRRYLDFTLEHRSTFPILLRCSPFSDVRLDLDRQRITDSFTALIAELQQHVERGIADGTIKDLPPKEIAFAIYANIVGAVRTRFISPYDVPTLYDESIRFVMRSIASAPESILQE